MMQDCQTPNPPTPHIRFHFYGIEVLKSMVSGTSLNQTDEQTDHKVKEKNQHRVGVGYFSIQ